MISDIAPLILGKSASLLILDRGEIQLGYLRCVLEHSFVIVDVFFGQDNTRFADGLRVKNRRERVRGTTDDKHGTRAGELRVERQLLRQRRLRERFP